MEHIIKDVAIYLRKSRGKDGEETEETLSKHKEILVSFAKEKNFRYVLYPEVRSGDRIDSRPEMQKLLKDIEEDLFDAVLVVDIDRLGRGDEEDSGKIKRIFRNTGTFIITPTKVYNLENEDDESYLEFQTFMARQEFKMIKKRFLRGKKAGARQGNWTNGIPPLPYHYEPKIKGLLIDEEKLAVYNMMKDMCLNQLLPPQVIAWKLNEIGIPAPKGGKWHGKVVQGILVDETHLGRIISNKTKGNTRKGQKVVYFPREQWIIRENCHQVVKTIEEHEKILEMLSKRRLSTKRGVRPKTIFSGLVKCNICGSIMQVHYNSKYNYNVLSCPGYNTVGKKCECKGIKESDLLNVILKRINQYIETKTNDTINNDTELFELNKSLQVKQKEFEKAEHKLKLVYDMYEEGSYSKEEFLQRRELRQKELENINKFINELRTKINQLNNNSFSEIHEKYKELKKNWEIYSDEEKNRLLHLILANIEYTRFKTQKENVKIRLNFK